MHTTHPHAARRWRFGILLVTLTTLSSCKPVLNTISPPTGSPRGGEVITIDGSSLDDVVSVTVCGEPAAILSQAATTLEFELPDVADFTGPCHVEATNQYGTGTAEWGFTYFEPGFQVGVLPNPTDLEGLLDAIQISAAASAVAPVWGGPTPWYEMADYLDTVWGPAGTMVDMHRDHGIEPILVMNPISGADKIVPDDWDEADSYLSSELFVTEFCAAAAEVAGDHFPAAMMIGNEVNTFRADHHGDPANDPDDFSYFVDLFEQAREAIQLASPLTRVFPTFAYNGLVHPQVDFTPVAEFDPATLDLITLTTYPFMTDVTGFTDPSDLPDDYYRQAKLAFPDATFAFTEIAWPSEEYGATEQQQLEFVDRFFELTSTLPKAFVVYFVLNDFEVEMEVQPGVFETVYWDWGLRRFKDVDGNLLPAPEAKLAWDAWIAWHDDSRPVEPPQRLDCDGAPETDLWPPSIVAPDLGPPEKLPFPVNTECAEDAVEVSPDGEALYFWWSADGLDYENPDVRTFTHTQFAYSRLTDHGWILPRQYDLTLGEPFSLNGETSHCPGTGEVFFHSLREDNLGYQLGLPPGQPFDIDIYQATIDGSTPTDLVHLDPPINTEYLDGEHFVTADGQTMYLASNRPGSLGDLDIFVSRRSGDDWSDPDNGDEMVNVNTAHKEYQATVTPDGAWLYFATDRTNPFGLDIYRAPWTGSEWGTPEPVCEGNCGGPSLTEDGCLYFVHVKTTNLLQNTKGDADIWVSCPL